MVVPEPDPDAEPDPDEAHAAPTRAVMASTPTVAAFALAPLVAGIERSAPVFFMGWCLLVVGRVVMGAGGVATPIGEFR